MVDHGLAQGYCTKSVHKMRTWGNLDEPLTLVRKVLMRFRSVALFSLVVCTAFVVRTGPRFRLRPSVGPYSVDGRLCRRAQQSDSATLGFSLAAQRLWLHGLGRRRAEFSSLCGNVEKVRDSQSNLWRWIMMESTTGR